MIFDLNNTYPPLHEFFRAYIENTTAQAIIIPQKTAIGKIKVTQLDGSEIKNFIPQYLPIGEFLSVKNDLQAIFNYNSIEKMSLALTDQLEKCVNWRKNRINFLQTSNKKLLSEKCILENVNKILISQFLSNND